MNYWKETTLGDVLTLQRGFDLSVTKRIKGPYPVIASTGPVGTNDTPMVKGPGVVIGRSGSIGGGQYIKSDFWPLNTTLWVKDFKKNDILFCFYLLKSLDFSRYNAGSGVPTLNRNHIYPIPVKIPPLPEQKAIAHTLSTLDDKIELNTRMNETLEAMAQALFKSWFVDFDPVRAKMAGREPEGMDVETAALFPDEIEVVDGREVPKGWEFSTIGKEVVVVGGSTPSTKNVSFWDNGSIPFATPKDMSSLISPVLLETERHITEAGLKRISSGILPKGTVLLSSRAPIGYLAIAEVPVTVNQGLIAMVCTKKLSNHFVLHWTKENLERIKANANGSTFQEISKKNFRPIKVIVPSSEIIEIYNRLLAPTHEKMTNNVEQSHSLAALRDTLLPKLISGEIRIDNPEQFLSSEVVT